MILDKIPFYVWQGMKARNWYAECEAVLAQQFGPDKVQLAAQCLAATSMNSYLKSNVSLARRAMYQIENNLPFHRVGFKNVRLALDRAKDGKGFSGRKTDNFWRAICGDTNAVVVDIWILRAFGLENTTPTKKQYDSIEAWIRQEAAARSIEPRQLQAMIWIGCREHVRGPDEANYSTVIKRKMHNLFNHF